MAWEKNRIKAGPLVFHGESGSLIAPDKLAGEIKNMNMTTAGSLRSVHGPVEYVPSKYQGAPTTKVYNDPLLGIFHCTIEGGARDILLAHFTAQAGLLGNQSCIREYRGWNQSWKTIIGHDAAAIYQIRIAQADGRPQFLTQFESTPTGVVIVPQGDRAYFYDGYAATPLGYSEIPGPPSGLGPIKNTVADGADSKDEPNKLGYSHTGQNMSQVMGTSRIGSVNYDGGGFSNQNPLGGTLEEGEWRASVQWLDRWGNVSALSGPSEPVKVDKQDNYGEGWGGPVVQQTAERQKVQVCWTGIPAGRDGTIGRVLCRTRDLKWSGSTDMYEIPNYSGTGILALSSIPDNTSEIFPDNVPDSWLLKVPMDPVPVPNFKLCRMAFGRLWIANWDGGEGVIRPSAPLFWGTFPKNEEIIPDPTGAHITGMWNSKFGLLVFTESSTFLIEPNAEGTGFRAATLNREIGCVSPDSIGTLPNGTAIWLGDTGFYAYDGKDVKLISSDITDKVIRRINRGYRLQSCAAVDMVMGEYRCSIPVDGSIKNNLIVIFDGVGWRERDDVKMQAVCVTRDHRSYMLALGYADATNTETTNPVLDKPSVWLLDHDGRGVYEADQHEGVIESHWLKPSKSFRRTSPLRVKIWLRETIKGALSVEVYRDWRVHPVVETAVSPKLYPTDDPPPFWDETILGGTHVDNMRPNAEGTAIDNFWTKRRPHWVVADVMVPAAEVYKFKFKYTGDWDFIGIIFEEIDSDGGGEKIPSGGYSGS